MGPSLVVHGRRRICGAVDFSLWCPPDSAENSLDLVVAVAGHTGIVFATRYGSSPCLLRSLLRWCHHLGSHEAEASHFFSFPIMALFAYVFYFIIIIEAVFPPIGYDCVFNSREFALCASHNDEVRGVTLKNAPENMKLTSPDIQKDIVNAVAVETVNIIIKDIGDALFSILVDESCDISIKEQMTIVLRYVD
ncbi:hypothetical protein L484_012004 [Morus notabilis]|uniref:DUF4371 domain-containing protein n=1 Tax=Morus notabilis TaxID=981085 RepID=W9RH74_9ROSA|nr:hypothetical protein L484_012004 [Morus notabilis]